MQDVGRDWGYFVLAVRAVLIVRGVIYTGLLMSFCVHMLCLGALMETCEMGIAARARLHGPPWAHLGHGWWVVLRCPGARWAGLDGGQDNGCG